MPDPRKISIFGPALVVLWLLTVGGGIWWLQARAFAPSTAGAPAAAWPEGGALSPYAGGHTLVVALHPECPCSMATLDQLDHILAQTEGKLGARLLIAHYDELPTSPEKSELWARASRLPRSILFTDRGGEERRRFDARTSGETRLYDPQGRLVFHGGITLGRGHRGDNPGQSTVLALVRGTPEAAPVLSTTPVFGCAL